MTDINKRADTDDYSVLENDLYIEKVILFQQRECCSKTHIKVPVCKKFLTRIVAAMNKGDCFNEDESVEIFFALTKLFMSKDLTMRRLLYVVLNDMIPYTNSSFIIVNSVSKDLSDKIASFRCSSLRCLSRLMTPQIAPTVERFFKQTLVDSTASVQIASLICCLKLPVEMTQKYLEETNSCVESHDALVQYHATRLFLYIKQNDQTALLRFITNKASDIHSSFAQMELIRCALKLYLQNPSRNEMMINFIVNVTKGSSDLIIVEALRSLLKADHLKGLTKMIPQLQRVISSNSTISKFAGVRIVNELAIKHPELIGDLSDSIENLLKDKNRAVITLATSAALRISTEQNIEKLLKKISKFIHGLPDTFRLQVLQTIEQSALKHSSKHEFLLRFLGNLLNVKGAKFEIAVVSSMVRISSMTENLREILLDILGEFIEDCQYETVIEHVIGIIGDIGPLFILEGPSVRAAGVSALYKFVTNEDDIEQVNKLMNKCINDDNDEVRSRALFYANIIRMKISDKIEKCVIDDYPLDNIEDALLSYIENGEFEDAFDFTQVSTVTQSDVEQQQIEEKTKQEENEYQKKMNEIFGGLGTVLKTTQPTLISGVETEIQVSVTKLIFKQHIALKFIIQNTLNDYHLENISIKTTSLLEHYEVFKSVPIQSLPPNGEEMAVLILKIKANKEEQISLQMDYLMREMNTITGEISESVTDDDYTLDPIQIVLSDFIEDVKIEDWETEWSSIPAQNEKKIVIKYQQISTIQLGIDRIKNHFGLGVINSSDVTQPNSKRHVLFLAGRMNGDLVLIRVRLMVDKSGQVPLEVCIRSPSLTLAELLHSTL
ncbi:Coatomer subunit gamma [Entamoeba marina]